MMRSLRTWRIDRGWSQQRLAIESGVATATISGIETGTRPHPHPSTRKLLADALGCLPSMIAEFADGGTGVEQERHRPD